MENSNKVFPSFNINDQKFESIVPFELVFKLKVIVENFDIDAFYYLN